LQISQIISSNINRKEIHHGNCKSLKLIAGAFYAVMRQLLIATAASDHCHNEVDENNEPLLCGAYLHAFFSSFPSLSSLHCRLCFSYFLMMKSEITA
jgi:hypothetical protein